jgi:hypothetical protein
MAIVLKQIKIGTLGGGATVTTDSVTPAGKVQVIKSIRLVNTSTTTAATLNISAGVPDSEKLVGPKDLSLAPRQAYLDETEIVLNGAANNGDRLKVVSTAGGGSVDYLVCGFERDQS